MPRSQRITIPGCLHHIVHRGNNQQKIFFDSDDYDTYLRLFERYKERYGFRVLSYCLMSNHVHIVGIPSMKNSISNLIQYTHGRYSVILNKKMGKCGHNWQSRHKAFPCDEFHGIASMRYTEMNPVRAGIVKKAWEYKWSSARVHTGLEKAGSLLDTSWWNMHFSATEWQSMLVLQADDDTVERIRESNITGYPLGDDKFHILVKEKTGKLFRKKSRGRKCQNLNLVSDTIFL